MRTNTVVCDGCGKRETRRAWWPRRAKRLGWIRWLLRVGDGPTVCHNACSLNCMVRVMERAERDARDRAAVLPAEATP